MSRTRLLTILATTTALLVSPTIARAALVGPVFPAPGGTTFSGTGTSGASGGRTFNYSAITVGSFSKLYWGASPLPTVALAPVTPTTLTYDASSSSLATGVARFTAPSVAYSNPTPGGFSGPLRVRLTVSQLSPATSALVLAPAEISSTGAVVDVLQAGSAFSVNLLFEAEYPPGSNVYIPVNQLAQSVAGTTQTSFNGGFFYAPSAAPTPSPALSWPFVAVLALTLPGIGLWFSRRQRAARMPA